MGVFLKTSTAFGGTILIITSHTERRKPGRMQLATIAMIILLHGLVTAAAGEQEA